MNKFLNDHFRALVLIALVLLFTNQFLLQCEIWQVRAALAQQVVVNSEVLKSLHSRDETGAAQIALNQELLRREDENRDMIRTVAVSTREVMDRLEYHLVALVKGVK